MPDLLLPNLVTLSVAENYIQSIGQEVVLNISSLKELDLSYNYLASVPFAVQSFKELRSLNLAGNPIGILTNVSFFGISDCLHELDIRDMPIQTFDVSI